MKSTSNGIFLIGDSRILIEFAEVCRAGRCQVSGTSNDHSPLPSFVRRRSTPVRTSTLSAELTILDRERKRKNLAMLERSLPSRTIILSSCCSVSAAEQSAWMKYPERLIGIGAFPTLMKNHIMEMTLSSRTDRELLGTAQEFFIKMGKEISVIQDRVGMVMPRILCQIINEAFFGLTEGIASPQDIDRAMKLGTGYPAGPVEWAERIGVRSIVAVLEGLMREYAEDRYRTAPLLRQLAFAEPKKV